jgi:hypothetical protein
LHFDALNCIGYLIDQAFSAYAENILMAKLWTCPYCNRPCTIDKSDIRTMTDYSFISHEYGTYRSYVTIVVCPNPACRQRTVSLSVHPCDDQGYSVKDPLLSWNLLPESAAKPFPDYIPKPLLDDYQEACLIRDKSPKASATLSRRCLQGIIRDFWKITKARLIDEINDLHNKVDPQTWQAIDSVRQVGNIGAHMEKDVNILVDVDPEEAGLLIWLIETLFQDWYVASYDRQQRMAQIVQVAQNKAAQKSGQLPSK